MVLIENGADVNIIDKFHTLTISKFQAHNVMAYVCLRTPLICASETGHVEVVRLLIDKGGDINAKDNFGSSPLIHASKGGHLNVVKLLIDIELIKPQRANLNAIDNFGSTPLIHALIGGHVDVVKLLIDSGSDLNAGDDYGRTRFKKRFSGCGEPIN
eukprot:GHVR01082561.1.p1 GENE.GHVR01082561.1~~GHVR01082561.1.p1  ORF type:complete len:157 (+),score=8.70 GHVR01082561.1:855-1325(+)